jgi:hypothetical protein
MNLNDAGTGSLRQAILDTPSGGTVDFQQGLSGTITLMTGELPINTDLTIAGPGPSAITVDGHSASRVFDIGATFTVNISGLTIADGHVTADSGGGIFNAGRLTITNATLSSNSAVGSALAVASGGGIFNAGAGMLTITNSTLKGNSATGSKVTFGGAIDNGGTLTITACTLSGNSVNVSGLHPVAYGGAIYNGGTLTVTNSTLSGNSATGGSNVAVGGGIENEGTATVISSTLSGNSASGSPNAQGGGIDNSFGTLTVISSTLSGNSVSSLQAYGGGIYDTRGTVTVTASTLSGNAVSGAGSRGGGIDNGDLLGSGTVITGNTILAANTAHSAPDVSGALNSQGYNLIGDGTGGSGYVDTDQVGMAGMPIDPRLGPLQNNGGPTQTMALLPGSPALDAGDPTQLGVADQRGVVRSGGVNIGAYQASASAFGLAAPRRVTAGVPFNLTVMAVDSFGQLAAGYTGTVTFSTTDPDPRVVLPADYAFTLPDGGVHTFTDTGRGETTLWTRGRRTITATDTSDGSLVGRVTVKVRLGGHTSPLSEAGADRPAESSMQLPAQPTSPEPAEGQSARSDESPGSASRVMPWRVWDAVFQGLDDPLVDLLTASLISQRW